MAVRIQMRRDTGANWTSNNPILAEGEMGIELDTHRWKVGDGVDAWNALPYSNALFTGPSEITGSDANTVLTITQLGSGNAFVVQDSPDPDATPFVINNAGYVGIGTPTPIAPLDVDGTARFTGQVAANNGILARNIEIGIADANTIGVTSGNLSIADNISFTGTNKKIIQGNFEVAPYTIPEESTELFRIQKTSTEYTVVEIAAPEGVGGQQEATLALMRVADPDSGGPEFMDVYNNGYAGAKNHGIRIQKRGTGVLRPFKFDFYDGTTYTQSFEIATNGQPTFNQVTYFQKKVQNDLTAPDSWSFVSSSNGANYSGIYVHASHDSQLIIRDAAGTASRFGAGEYTINGNNIWHAGNDGAASGLDADLLDGQHGSYYTGYTDAYNATKLKVFNVKEYGALGDGSNDDTAEIQAAIDAAAVVNGTVYIPSGTYKITAPLVLPSWSPITIKGSGWKSIIQAGASANLSYVFTDGATTQRLWQVLLEDFAIDGQVTSGNASVVGIYVAGHTSIINKVMVYNCYDGINLDRQPTDPSNYWGANIITSCIVSDCDHQAYRIPVDTTIQHSGLGEIGTRVGYSEAWDTCGVYVGSWDCRIIGNHFWGVNGPVVWANWVEHLIVANNVMEKTYGPYVFLDGRAYLANITGNVFEDKTADGDHEPKDWTGEPFIKLTPAAGQKQALLISNNMFSEITGKPRGLVISENANTDYGLYQGNVCAVAPTTYFSNMLGANSIQANNMMRGVA